MSKIFIGILNMSISASYAVLAILLLRLLLKKAPKWISVALWSIAAFRLICPFSVESVLSLIPSAEVVSPDVMMEASPTVNTGIPLLNGTLNPIISGSLSPNPGDSANPLQIIIPFLALVWVIGVSGMLIYTAVSYMRIKKKVSTAVLLDGNIYQSENVQSPFVLGLIKPKIYLPFHMNEKNIAYVVAHEQAHIRRRDHLWKPLGFLLLALHWFNPLMWLGYVLLCRDIELACDEKVAKGLGREERADYSEALLAYSVSRKMISACPLAFGEVGVKNRVKSVLNYKKPTFWIIVAAVALAVVAAACLLTDPVNRNPEHPNESNVNTNLLLSCTRYEFGLDGTQKQTALKFNSETEKEIISIISNITGWSQDISGISFVFDVEFRFEQATYLYCTAYGYLRTSENGETTQLGAWDKNMLNGFIEDASAKLALVYDAPMYSYYMKPSQIPLIEIENGVIYTTEDGVKERLGTVNKTSIRESDFDAFIKGNEYFDYSELAKSLRENNESAYEVIPDAPIAGIELYYIMEQKSGETLIVYGHYADDRKDGIIRFIYQYQEKK